jgi:hypothetical protein
MRIAFDLDQTQIPYGDEFAVERPPRFLAPFFKEPLRQGAVPLLRQLQAGGCDLWIYTTSARSPSYLRLWLLLLGIRLGGVVNCYRHDRESRSQPYRFAPCVKYPPAFGIDLLVDDSVAVANEGRRYGFEVLCIDPADSDWVETVLGMVRRRFNLR